MNASVLRWANPAILIFGTLLGIAVQTTVFTSYPLLYLQPDIVLILTLWMALRRDWIEGGVIVLLSSHFQELHSGGLPGVFLVLNMSVFLALRALSKFLVIRTLVQLVTATLFVSIFWRFALLGLLALLGLGEQHWRHTLTLALPSAVMEGAISVWIYRILERLDRKTLQTAADEKVQAIDSLEEETL